LYNTVRLRASICGQFDAVVVKIVRASNTMYWYNAIIYNTIIASRRNIIVFSYTSTATKHTVINKQVRMQYNAIRLILKWHIRRGATQRRSLGIVPNKVRNVFRLFSNRNIVRNRCPRLFTSSTPLTPNTWRLYPVY